MNSKIPLEALVCPDCRTALSSTANGLHCGKCGADFPISGGVTKLYPPSRVARIEAELMQFAGRRRAVRGHRFFRAFIPPNPLCDPGAPQREARVRAKLGQGLILNLGSKNADWGSHVCNVDLAAPSGGGVDLLCDIGALPFAGESVDGAICTYVLEHVADARICMDEIARVTRPGGHVYVAVPFLFPTHPDPLDRWRWTLDGLRHAMSAFEECESGCSGGPFSAYVSITPTLLASCFSNFYLFNTMRFLLGWLLWPLKFLDHLVWRSKRAHMAAANFYFFGRKR